MEGMRRRNSESGFRRIRIWGSCQAERNRKQFLGIFGIPGRINILAEVHNNVKQPHAQLHHQQNTLPPPPPPDYYCIFGQPWHRTYSSDEQNNDSSSDNSSVMSTSNSVHSNLVQSLETQSNNVQSINVQFNSVHSNSVQSNSSSNTSTTVQSDHTLQNKRVSFDTKNRQFWHAVSFDRSKLTR